MGTTWVDFAHVKQHALFEPILAHYGFEPRGRGDERAILCPFHKETKPSCKVHLVKRVFHCFGCGAKGNVLEFVARIEGGELRAAALQIAELCGFPSAPDKDAVEKAEIRVQDRARDASERETAEPSSSKEAAGLAAPGGKSEDLANLPLTFTLKLDPEHPSLADRGFSPEVVAAFGLGYCSKGMMKGRLCIPIHDATGQLVAYAGRWVDAGEPPEGEDRYKLPPKFRKTLVLFNLHRVPVEAEHLVLVEGYWSAIRLHALGYPVAALMGRDIAKEQLALLYARKVRRLTLLLDGDGPGRSATDAMLPPLARSFFVYAPELASCEKPDNIASDRLATIMSA